MAILSNAFNAMQYDPTQGGASALPVGRHMVIAFESSIEGSKNNTASGMLVYKLRVLDGPQTGKEGLLRINLYNASEKARAIAERQFSAMVHCCNMQNQAITDTAMLHNIPFAVDVEPQDTDEGREKGYTEIRRILGFHNGVYYEPTKAGMQPTKHAAPVTAQPAQQQQQQAPVQDQQQPVQQQQTAQQTPAWGAPAAQQQQPAAQQQAPAQSGAPAWGQAAAQQPAQQQQAPATGGGWAPAPATGAPAWGTAQ